MARQITVAFAVDGNRVEVPVPTQISGEVSYQTGYTFDYSRPVSDPQAKNIERVKLNAVLYDITGVLQQFQQQGAPEWYADTPYAQFARVKHGGNYYVAAVDGTEQEPGTGEEWSLDNIAAQARKNNLTATTDPTATDDESEGYEPLSQWINTVSGEVFIAITVAEGAAVWQQGTFTVDELGNVALLNANAIGQSIIQSANPSAVRFMRANADNSVSWLSAEDFRAALALTNTDGLPEGTTNLYHTPARVRSSALTGFVAGIGFTAVIATDTILQALQKIQGWLSSLGTASQANLVASNTDTTSGRVPTTGWMGAGARSIPVDAGGTLSTNQVSGFYNYTNHGLPLSTAVGGITVQILATADYTVSFLGRNGRFFGVTRENGNQTNCEFWTDANLIKVASPTDTTAGSLPVVGWMGMGTHTPPTQALASVTNVGVFSAAAGDTDNPMSSTQPYINLNVSSNYGGMIMLGRSGVPTAPSYGVKYRTKNAGTFNDWQTFWDTGNLVKTTSPRDRTPGSMLQVDAGGLLGTSGLETTTTPLNDYPIANGFINGSAMTEETPLGVRPMGIQFGATAGNIVQLGGGSNSGPDLRFRKKIGASWAGPFTFIHTGNTSADVQAMLGAANNEAIRSSIGTAKKLAVANVSTADHFVTAGNESLYHRFTFNGAKTVTVRPNSTHALPADGSWVLRNVGTGNLTIVEGSGVTINEPYGGTLVLEPGMTVTLQKVGTNEYDLIGQTVPA